MISVYFNSHNNSIRIMLDTFFKYDFVNILSDMLNVFLYIMYISIYYHRFLIVIKEITSQPLHRLQCQCYYLMIKFDKKRSAIYNINLSILDVICTGTLQLLPIL